VYLINNYYDVNDPGNPIKSRLEPGPVMSFAAGSLSTTKILVKENLYTVHDAWLQIIDSDPKSFYTLKTEVQLPWASSYDVIDPAQTFYGIIVVRIEQSELNTYETTVINILDIFGLMGGVFELLQITVGVLISIVSSYYLHREITDENEQNANELFSYPPFYKNNHSSQNDMDCDYHQIQNEIQIMLEPSRTLRNRPEVYSDNANINLEENKDK
jgi:hypothetical protein